MRLNKEHISEIILNRNNLVYGVFVFVIVAVFGFVTLEKGTYSVDEEIGIDGLTITCPESALKGETIECLMELSSLTIETHGMSAKFNIPNEMEFVEIVSDAWEVTTSSQDGAVLINLSGVTDADSVGIVKFVMPEDGKSNDIYKLELFDVVIGNGEDTVVELSNVSDEIRIKSDINTLDNITLSNSVLNEEFVKENNVYTTLIDSDKTVISVVKTDQRATVLGDGEVNIHYGTNNFDIVVTSETGDKNTYKLEVYREYKFSSDVYKYSEEDAYIYTGVDTDSNVILSKVNLNDGLSRKIENNKLIISYGTEVLKEYNIISVSSSVYNLDKEYIYTGTNEFDLSKINVVNGEKELSENKLIIKYENEVLNQIAILSIDLNFNEVVDNLINLENKISYNTFISFINVSGELDYKILNNGEIITNGDIEHGMVLNISYNNIELDSYDISVYSLEFSNDVMIDDVNKYIKYFSVGTKVSEFLEDSFTTNGNAYLYDRNGNKKSNEDVIKTGDELKVFIGNILMDEYSLSVLGDSNGDGRFSVIDVAQLRKHLVKWKNDTTGEIFEMKGVYKEAFDFNKDGNISIVDLAIMRKKLVGLI